MKGMNQRYALSAGALISFGLHALAVAGLSTLPRPATLSSEAWVEVSIADKTLATPAPVPDSEGDTDRASSTAPKSLAASPAPRPAPSKPDAPSALPDSPPEPLDLTGTTLTGEGGSWAVQPGNGRASRGPIRIGRPRAGGRTPPPETNPKMARSKPASAIMSAASLATPPRAPNLNATLAQNYPAAARARGIGGDAVVRVRIGPEGHVTSVSVISESFPGFGAACRATVLGSVWTPPLDASGKPVGTVVRYRCRFRVES